MLGVDGQKIILDALGKILVFLENIFIPKYLLTISFSFDGKIYMKKISKKIFLVMLFCRCPYFLKRYQNTSGCGTTGVSETSLWCKWKSLNSTIYKNLFVFPRVNSLKFTIKFTNFNIFIIPWFYFELRRKLIPLFYTHDILLIVKRKMKTN